MRFRRWALVVALIGLALALLLTIGPGSAEVIQVGHPDWTTKTEVVNSELYVTVTNSTLDVNVTNSEITISPAQSAVFVISPESSAVFNVSGTVDANITNSTLDVKVTNSKLRVDANITNTELNVFVTNASIDVNANITNSTLDVKVTNSTLTVSLQGTANVEIQNAQVNVRTLREQVINPSDLESFDWTPSLYSNGWDSTTVYTNNHSSTVYVEYLTISTVGADPNKVYLTIYVYNSSGSRLFTLYCSGKEFLNFDPAIPVPAGGRVDMIVYNKDSASADIYVSGIVRLIGG